MNIGDNLRHQFVRLSYSPEIMSMEFTREEMITIYDYIKSKEEEIERLNNIINEIEKFMDEDYEYYKKYGSAEQGHAMGQISRFRNKMKELKGVDKE